MRDFEDFDFNKIEVAPEGLKENGVGWFTRALLRFWPSKGVARLARKFSMDPELMEKANDLFSKVKRVDIFPSKTGGRGFQIILNRSTALYFYQDGGDVTIFDRLK